jgi:myo-inositol-1(or 4)-monophosphatase
VIDLAYVACGRFDGCWGLRLGSWDVAAGSVLVEEAGGLVTGVDGGPLDVDAPTLLATNGVVHQEMLSVLKEVRG